MKAILLQLVDGKALTRAQATEAFDAIMSGTAAPASVGALLAMIAQRGPTVDEIVGAAGVMRAKATPVRVPDGMTVIDTCGAGGTGSPFFNVSTAAAIVVASVGRERNVGVAKHGNRSVTSRSGSSQVLEALGVNLQVPPAELTRHLDQVGICFCFAPNHHPAMKHAGPIRQELGIRTIFNLLGPLTNPAGALRQLVGVPTPALTRVFAEVLRELGAERALVVHSTTTDGLALGELTCFGANCATELRGGRIADLRMDPLDLGLPRAEARELTVAGPEESAAVIGRVFDGEAGPASDLVRLNAAAALTVADLADDLKDGLAQATAALKDGRARQTLERWAAMTRGAAAVG